MALNGRALAAVSLGTVFVWSGIRGWSVLATIGDILGGKKPNQPVSYNLSIAASGVAAETGEAIIGSGANAQIATIAAQYVGHRYVFGSAPGPDGSKPWDCSSFVNYVVGVKAGRAIPGYKPGKYTGKVHGPPTGSWYAWPGMDTVKRADVQAGDILLWTGHMGIALSNESMISALNAKKGTRTQRIDSGVGRGPIVRIGRLR